MHNVSCVLALLDCTQHNTPRPGPPCPRPSSHTTPPANRFCTLCAQSFSPRTYRCGAHCLCCSAAPPPRRHARARRFRPHALVGPSPVVGVQPAWPLRPAGAPPPGSVGSGSSPLKPSRGESRLLKPVSPAPAQPPVRGELKPHCCERSEVLR